jgi:hypothetical protein
MAPFGIEAAMRAFLRSIVTKKLGHIDFFTVGRVVALAGRHGPRRTGRAFARLPVAYRPIAKERWPTYWTAWCDAAGVSEGIQTALRQETQEVRANGNALLQNIENACEGIISIGPLLRPHRTVAAVGRVVHQRNECAKALHALVERADPGAGPELAAAREALALVPPAVYNAPFDVVPRG